MIMESWQASCDRAITNELDPFVVGVQRDKLCNGCDELFYKVYGCDGCGEFYGCRECMTKDNEGDLLCPECLGQKVKV